MKNADLARYAVNKFEERIQSAERGKKRILSFKKHLEKRYKDREITHENYLWEYEKKIDGGTIEEWIRYYDSYILYCKNGISKNQKTIFSNKIIIIFLSSFLFLSFIFTVFYFTPTFTGFYAQSFDDQDNRTTGYEYLNDSGAIVNETDATTIHIWNSMDDYFFNKSSGIQLTNHFDEYWSHNIFCGGYKNATNDWVYKCNDALPFIWNIKTDNETYVNYTGYRDITIATKEVRAAIRYHLKPNDRNITIQMNIENIGTEDIATDTGFAWRVKEIKIGNDAIGDKIYVNNTYYWLNETLDLTFTSSDLENDSYFFMVDDEKLRLDWNKNLNYRLEVKSQSGQYNAPTTLGINAGSLAIGQQKITEMYWIDAKYVASANIHAPSSDPDISTDDTFTMTCSWTEGGSGSGLPNQEITWQYDEGTPGTYVAIPTSGGLSTSDSTQVINHDVQTDLTITGKSADEYYVRCAHVGDSIYSTAQVVTVNVLSYGNLSVNISIPTDNSEFSVNDELVINATVTCVGGSCGTISALARYNLSANVDTAINVTEGALPFYIKTTGLGDWNLSAMSYNGVSIPVGDITNSVSAVFFKPDGTRVYFTGRVSDEVFSFDCSDPWNLSSCSNDSAVIIDLNAPTGIFFKPDGSKMYLSRTSGNDLAQYNCSDPWNLSSCFYDDAFYENVDTGYLSGIFFKPDGIRLYFSDSTEEAFYQLNCSDPWNLSSCSYDSISISSQDANNEDIFFNSEGTILYESGGGMIYQYNCSDPWNLSSCSYDSISFTLEGSGTGVFLKPDGSKMYEADADSDSIYEYDSDTISFASNPISITLSEDESWNVTFTTNITASGIYEIDVFFNSSYGDSNVPDNDTEDRTVIIQAASTLVVSLNSPTNNYVHRTRDFSNVIFNCSAVDNMNVTNISLYLTDNSDSNFALNETCVLGSVSGSCNWTKYLPMGDYTWNCLAHDNDSQEAWGNSNYSFSVDNYIGTQTHYRWRNDDGNEFDSTWKAFTDAIILNQDKEENARLRFSVLNTNVSSAFDFTFQIATKGVASTCEEVSSSSFSDVPTTADGCGSDIACITSSVLFTDGTSTTNQIYSTWSDTINPTSGTDVIYTMSSDDEFIYAAGYEANNVLDWRIEKRYKINGSLVDGFGSNGIISEQASSSDDRIYSIIADGDYLYLAGFDYTPGDPQWRIEKRNKTSGNLCTGTTNCTDGAFDGDGIILGNVSGGEDKAVAMDYDGDYIYIGGYDGALGVGNGQFRIEKRNKTDGSLETEFGSSGVVQYNYGSNGDLLNSLAVDSKYIYSGGFSQDPADVENEYWYFEKRNKTSGNLCTGTTNCTDGAFDGDGIILLDEGTLTSLIDDSVMFDSIIVDDDYLYINGADYAPGNTQWRIEKRNKTSGNLCTGTTNCTDGAFNTDGIILLNPSSNSDIAMGSAIYGDSLYIIGSDGTEDGGLSRYRIHRINVTTGNDISEFGTNGVVTINPSSSPDDPRAIVVDSTAIYIGGYDSALGNIQWRYDKLDLITGASYNWISGKMAEDPTNKISGISLEVNDYTEVEYNFQLTSNAANGTTYCFRVEEVEGCDNVASITTSGISDLEYPQFSNYWDDNASLSDSGVGHFNVTVSSTNGTVLLEIDGNNITATNLTADVYNVSYTFSSSGVYSYKWHSLGNGTNENYNVSEVQSYVVNSSNVAPQITYVESISAKDPLEGGARNVTFNFTVSDSDGASNINSSTTEARFQKSGEITRVNTSCVELSTSGNEANYSCIIGMWYFDGSGTWDINITIEDNSGERAENSTTTFTYNLLTAMAISPTALDWPTINPSDTDVTSSTNPITINNTGNDDGLSINVTGYDLQGLTTTSEYIFASNFTVDQVTDGCSGTSMINSTDVIILSAILQSGNNSINAGDDTSGQEELFFCLSEVPQGISAQDYSSSGIGAWAIRIFMVLLTPVKKRKKKKEKLAREDNLVKAIGLIFNELKDKYNSASSAAMKVLVGEVMTKYGMTKNDVMELIGPKQLIIPVSVFSGKIGGLEALSKYMKENLGMKYVEIGEELNRNQKTIWTSYNKASKKQKKGLDIEDNEFTVPVDIFSNRKLTIFAAVVIYLKNTGMSYVEIGKLLNRDQRNIWTVYNRGVKKNGE